MLSVKVFFQKEPVFCISLLLALASCLLVHPDWDYLAYPDYRTLALLFCLMIVVAGFQSLGVFALLGRTLLRMARSVRRLSLMMVALCFFCSMVITNDVTLITFVPFTMLVFRMIDRPERLVRLVVLETVAANLGSMATPIGNPQNLYLCTSSGISMGQFARAVLPYAGIALVLLLTVVWIQRDELIPDVTLYGGDEDKKRKLLPAVRPFVALLALCLLVVFRVLPYLPVLLCVAAVVVALDRSLFRSVDYFLLLTFLCFFLFVGNIKRIPEISNVLTQLVSGRELWAGILASQVISNVPAAILLAEFAQDLPTLITAVNLGGLGTLIASLASLISFQLFARDYPEKKGVFLKAFTGWNLVFLLVLSAAAVVLTGL